MRQPSWAKIGKEKMLGSLPVGFLDLVLRRLRLDAEGVVKLSLVDHRA